MQQFLDFTANTRTDQWGGSVENRARFCLEVVKVLIEVWGADRVAVKLNPAGGYNDVGMPLKDTVETYSYVIKALNELKVVYIALTRYVAAMDPTLDGIFYCCRFYLFAHNAITQESFVVLHMTFWRPTSHSSNIRSSSLMDLSAHLKPRDSFKKVPLMLRRLVSSGLVILTCSTVWRRERPWML